MAAETAQQVKRIRTMQPEKMRKPIVGGRL